MSSMTIAQLMAASVEDNLEDAWVIFEANTGSATYQPSFPGSFKSLFRNNVTWRREELDQDELDYLLGVMLPWMGEYIQELPSFAGAMTEAMLVKTREAAQSKAYRDNGDKPTKIC